MSPGSAPAPAGPTAALPLLKGAYALASRLGLLRRPLFRRLYSRAYFAYKRGVEDPFAALLFRRPEIARGGSVLDVGANIGYTVSVFSAAIDPGRHVYAFEPDAANAGLMAENLAGAIGDGRVVPVQAAVGAAPGEAVLLRSAWHPGDHRLAQPEAETSEGSRDRVAVPVVSIDGFLEAREPEAVAFVKIDVQGGEIDVCRGMARLLERQRVPAIAIEHSPRDARALGHDPELAPAFLRERGYALRLLRRDGATQAWPTPEAEALLARRGYVDLLAER